MSDLFNIGRSAVTSYQKAISTVSQNIANAENPDYVRRRSNIGDATVTGKNALYLSSRDASGVYVSGMTRLTDPALDNAVRFSGAERVRTETVTAWMERAEDSLSAEGDNIGSRMNMMFARAEEVAATPFDTGLRRSFLDDMENITSEFRYAANNLIRNGDDLGQSAQLHVKEVNLVSTDLAAINKQLLANRRDDAARASLLDQRDAALTVMTEKLDVDISFDDIGRATVSYGGENLVIGGDVAELAMSVATDGSFDMTVDGTAVDAPEGGILGGMNESSVSINATLGELDSQASQFMTEINNWHAQGLNDAGNAGAPIIMMTGGVTTMTVANIAPADLALAASDGTPNGNILALQNLRGSGGAETRWENFLAGQANAVAAAKSDGDAAAALHDSTQEARDNISKVDIDREVADLVRLQQAYQASARIIQVGQENVQTILGLF